MCNNVLPGEKDRRYAPGVYITYLLPPACNTERQLCRRIALRPEQARLMVTAGAWR